MQNKTNMPVVVVVSFRPFRHVISIHIMHTIKIMFRSWGRVSDSYSIVFDTNHFSFVSRLLEVSRSICHARFGGKGGKREIDSDDDGNDEWQARGIWGDLFLGRCGWRRIKIEIKRRYCNKAGGNNYSKPCRRRQWQWQWWATYMAWIV